MVTRRPMIDGDAPYRRLHSPSLMTMTRSLPGSSSAADKARPITGRVPSTSKKLPVTSAPLT